MNSTHVKKVAEELAKAVGLPINSKIIKTELLDQKANYTAEKVDLFVEDLLKYARKFDLTLIVNHLPIGQFNELLAVTEYPILYFEQNGQEFIPVLGGRGLNGNELALTLAGNQVAYNPLMGVQNPVMFKNQTEASKNGQVIFLTAFPMEPLVSRAETLHKEELYQFTPMQRLIRLLGNERKDIGYIYFYAIVVGLISLVLPLGVQAIFNLVSSGMVFSSVYVLMGLVLLGLIGSSYMQIVQVTLVEILQRRITFLHLFIRTFANVFVL